MDKPLLCGKTAKDYKFWDNLMYHYKTLYPLYDKKVDFAQYTSVHDGWLFSNPKNLKLHNKVCKFEQAQATEVEKRVNLDNPGWVHPCNRRDERYLEDDLDSVPNPEVKKSRFLKKERKVELSYKDQVEPTPPEVPRRRRKEAKPLPELKKPETEERRLRLNETVTGSQWPTSPTTQMTYLPSQDHHQRMCRSTMAGPTLRTLTPGSWKLTPPPCMRTMRASMTRR